MTNWYIFGLTSFSHSPWSLAHSATSLFSAGNGSDIIEDLGCDGIDGPLCDGINRFDVYFGVAERKSVPWSPVRALSPVSIPVGRPDPGSSPADPVLSTSGPPGRATSRRPPGRPVTGAAPAFPASPCDGRPWETTPSGTRVAS